MFQNTRLFQILISYNIVPVRGPLITYQYTNQISRDGGNESSNSATGKIVALNLDMSRAQLMFPTLNTSMPRARESRIMNDSRYNSRVYGSNKPTRTDFFSRVLRGNIHYKNNFYYGRHMLSRFLQIQQHLAFDDDNECAGI